MRGGKDGNSLGSYPRVAGSSPALASFIIKLTKMNINENEQAGVVYRTYDYRKFSFFPENREPSHWPKIAASIETKDLTAYVPILVDNEHRIIDGQGRYRACIENKLPIHYIVGDVCDPSDIIRLNVDRKDWSNSDYLRYYVRKGYREYITLDKLLKRSKYVKLGAVIYNIANHKAESMSVKETFQRGNYWITVEEVNIVFDVDDFLFRISGIVEKTIFGSRNFISAISRLRKTDEVDMEQLFEKIKKYSTLLEKQVSHAAYMENLEDVYNYRSRSKISFKYIDES